MKRFHKLTAWMLTLAMLFTMLPSFSLTAFAAESLTDSTTGVILADSDGDDYYEVDTPDKLVAFANLVNAGNDSINIELTDDIDMTGKEWSMIVYGGTIDGNEHTVSNLTFVATEAEGEQYAGLIYAYDATVKNITFEYCRTVINSTTSSERDIYAAIIAPVAIGGIFENCSLVNCTVTQSGMASGCSYAGSLAGLTAYGLKITGCSVEGCTVTDDSESEDGSFAGGLAGGFWADEVVYDFGVQVKNNTINADVTAKNSPGVDAASGLICSVLDDSLAIAEVYDNCTVDGTITADDVAAGLIGDCCGYDMTISNCTVLCDSISAAQGDPFAYGEWAQKGIHDYYTMTYSNLKISENTEFVCKQFENTLGKYYLSDLYADGAFDADIVSFADSAAEVSYTVTVSDSIENGTVEADVSEAAEGETVTLTVTPADGYVLDTLTVKDADDNVVTVTDNKFTMPAKNVTVTAVFKESVTYVASVTVSGVTTNYETFTEALTEANANAGSILTLLSDVTLSNYAIISGGFALELNGQTIDCGSEPYYFMIQAGASLTLKDSGTDGAIISTSLPIYNHGSLTVEGGKIEGASVIRNQTEAELHIKGGTINDIGNNDKAIHNCGGSITVDDGTITSKYIAINNDSGAMTVNGGKFDGGSYSVYVGSNSTDAKINDGTFNGKVWGFGDYTINGGSFTNGYIGINKQDGVLTVNGGNFNIAEINIRNGTVSISGGTFTGGIKLYSKNGLYLADILADGKAYYQNDAEVTLTEGQLEITGGDVAVKAATAPTTYTVSVSDTIENGTVTASKATAAEGVTVTLTVTPAEGYELDTLTVRDSDNGNVTVTDNKFTMPAKNVTVTATFKSLTPVIESITFNSDSTAYDSATNTFCINAENPLVLTVTGKNMLGQNMRFLVANTNVDAVYADVTSTGDETFTYTVDEDFYRLIMESFEASNYEAKIAYVGICFADESPSMDDLVALNVTRKSYTVTVNTASNGTVTADKENAAEGETVTLTITPADGYVLDTLTVKDADDNDVTVTDNKFTMPAKNVAVTATFAEICDHSGSEHTSATDNGDGTHSFKCTVCGGTGNEDHNFGSGNTCDCGIEIKVTGMSLTADTEYRYDAVTDTYTVVMVPGDSYADVTVKFNGENLKYLTEENTMLLFERDDNIFPKPYTTSIYRLKNYDFGTTWNVGLTPENLRVWFTHRYTNDGGTTWSDKLRYEVVQAYSITADDSENGTVSIEDNKTYAIEGETVTLTITPDDGYIIDSVKYNDGTSDTEITAVDGIYSFTMPAEDVSISVTFLIDVVRNFVVKRYEFSDKYALSGAYAESFFTAGFEHNFAEGKFDLSKEELKAAANLPDGYEITNWKICPARYYNSAGTMFYELFRDDIKAYEYQAELSFEDASDYKYYVLIPIAEQKNYISTHPTEEEPSVSVVTTQSDESVSYKWFRTRAMKETISPQSERVIVCLPDALETYKDGKWYLKDEFFERGAVVLNRIRLNEGETINISVYGDTLPPLASVSIWSVSDRTSDYVTIEAVNNTFTYTAAEDVEFMAYICYIGTPSFTENDYIVYEVIDLSAAEEISGETGKTLSSEAIAAGYSYFAEVDFNGITNKQSRAFGVEYEITQQPTSSKPYVKTNADEDVSEYSWYKVGKETREHTEVITPTSLRYEDRDMPFPRCDEAGWWSINGNGYNIAAVMTDFKAGERIKVETAGVAEVESIEIYNNQETQEIIFTLEKISETEWSGEFTEDIPDGIVLVRYSSNMTPNEDKHRVSVTTEIIDDILVEGETGSKLSKGVTGEEYYAVISFGDWAELVSDSFEWKPTGNSSGGGSSNTTTTTTKNEDGSTTKTTTNKVTGTTTEVTTNTDGSTTTVETKKDGTVTTTEKDKDGNTTTTVENPDGTSTTTEKNKDGSETVVEKDAEGTTTTTEKDSEGNKTVTTEKADGTTTTEETKKDGTTVKTETNADGETTAEVEAKGETEVVIPVENADEVTKVVVTDKNGNETEVEFEVKDGGVAISVSGNSTVSVQTGHTCYAKDFTDVDLNAWYHLNVDYVLENGLFKGTTETTFAPNANLTRAMLVAVLYRAEGEPKVSGITSFADLEEGGYYFDAVCWAQVNGIVNGVSETEFAPDQNITREQIAAIMHRYAQYKGYDVSVGENTNILSYDDFDSISEYAIPSMQYAVGSGLMKGKTTSTLNPLDNATRAEIAAILNRFIEANK